MNGGLNGSTIRNGLVGVDALVGLLAVEEVRNKLDDTVNTGRSTNQDNFVDISLVNLGVTENLLNRLQDLGKVPRNEHE